MQQRLTKYLTILLVILLGINVIYAAIGAYAYPLAHVDVWSIWLFKSKLIYLCKGNWIPVITENNYLFSHPEYPLLWPAVGALLYQIFGSLNETAVSLISPIIYGIILVFCYKVISTISKNKTSALFFTYVYSMIPPLQAQAGRLHAGMADIIVCLLYWALVYLSLKKPTVNWLIPLLIVMIAAQIKTEGILAILVLWIFPFNLGLRSALSLIALLSPLSWGMLRQFWHLPVSYSQTIYPPQIIWHRFAATVQDTIRELFLNLSNWYFIWYLVAATLLLPDKLKDVLARQLKMLIIILFGAFTVLYLTSTVGIEGYVASSLDRLMLQISPLWFTFAVLKTVPLLNQETLMIPANHQKIFSFDLIKSRLRLMLHKR